MTILLAQLAQCCDAEMDGTSALEITSAADIMSAEEGQVTVLSSRKYTKFLNETKASACFISDTFSIEDAPKGLVFLRCSDPEISFLKAVAALHPEKKITRSIAKQSFIADTVNLGNDIHIGAFVAIDEHSSIGDGTEILANVSIGRNVSIGKNCRIHPNVSIYDDTKIADHVIIHSGTIIGADGFGYKFRNNEHVKVPHVGNVVIESHVEIGANTCIDRGALGATRIGAGTKIDNLIQIGHNCQVGKLVIICGQSGMSGSCVIGDGVVLAGGASISDHVTIGEQAVVMAKTGVASDVEPHSQVLGIPAKDRKVASREWAAISNLPSLFKKFRALDKRVKTLENE